jgi:SAM-dependent methyltransferase
MQSERARREQEAYDEGRVMDVSFAWHMRVRHVLEGPNTMRGEQRFDALLRRHAAGGRVLDVGCAEGVSTLALLDAEPAYVLGIDTSTRFIESARRHEQPGRVEFVVGDVTQPLEGTFDLIFGRSILHHIDWRPFVHRVYEHNLAPGGALVFMEPVGSNLFSKAFHALVRQAHTPDERPFMLDDQRWLRESFAQAELVPINYLSFPAGILSSFVFSAPDNRLMRAADRVDRELERLLPPRMATAQARQLIAYVPKPGDREQHLRDEGG